MGSIAKSIKLDRMCKSIMGIDRNVRSVAAVDSRGDLVHSEVCRGFTQTNLERWNDPHFMECTFDISMGAKIDVLYGPIRYHHSDKDDFLMFSFPFEKNVFIVTSTKRVSPIAFATKIAMLINNLPPQQHTHAL